MGKLPSPHRDEALGALGGARAGWGVEGAQARGYLLAGSRALWDEGGGRGRRVRLLEVEVGALT